MRELGLLLPQLLLARKCQQSHHLLLGLRDELAFNITHLQLCSLHQLCGQCFFQTQPAGDGESLVNGKNARLRADPALVLKVVVEGGVAEPPCSKLATLGFRNGKTSRPQGGVIRAHARRDLVQRQIQGRRVASTKT